MAVTNECDISDIYEMKALQAVIKRFPPLTANGEKELGRTISNNTKEFVSLVLKSESKEKEIIEIQKFFSEKNGKDSLFKDNDKIFEYSVEKIRNLSARFPENENFTSLLNKIESINYASDKLIKSNLRLVVRMAKSRSGKGLSILDLFQEGFFGLRIVAFRFDYTVKNRFSTFAVWWIRQMMNRALATQSRTIAIPVNIHDKICEISRTIKYLSYKLEREPTIKEIAKSTNTTFKKIALYLEIARFSNITLSLEKPVGGKDGREFGDFIEDDKGTPQDKAVIDSSTAKAIGEALSTLTPREEKIIRMRFGVGEKRDYTLAEVGREFNVGRERVRQIETAALKKLRHPTRMKKLL